MFVEGAISSPFFYSRKRETRRSSSRERPRVGWRHRLLQPRNRPKENMLPLKQPKPPRDRRLRIGPDERKLSPQLLKNGPGEKRLPRDGPPKNRPGEMRLPKLPKKKLLKGRWMRVVRPGASKNPAEICLGFWVAFAF